jgi:hypothetical protein
MDEQKAKEHEVKNPVPSYFNFQSDSSGIVCRRGRQRTLHARADRIVY